jgi:hypothetical protein
MPCKLLRLKQNDSINSTKISNLVKHGDLVIDKKYNALYVVYKIEEICELRKCDTGKYFPRVCNTIPTSITKYITDPYNHYKQYFEYIQEINLSSIVHYDIIKQYVQPDSHTEYTLDKDSFYVIDENGFIDSYNINTFQLEHSHIHPFTGY